MADLGHIRGLRHRQREGEEIGGQARGKAGAEAGAEAGEGIGGKTEAKGRDRRAGWGKG